LLPFVAILATEKVLKFFSLKFNKNLSSRFYNYFFCHSEHNAVKSDYRGSFSRLFLIFSFWTFIFVHFSKPKILSEKNMLLKIQPYNQHLLSYDNMVTIIISLILYIFT
jgi:hypothetical protein